MAKVKEIYLSLMEKVFDVYSKEEIENMICRVEAEGITEHGFPRLTANLGILLARGRRRGMESLFLRMMELCAFWTPVAKQKNGGGVGNDFAVKELIFCLLEVERAGLFPKETTDGWRKSFASLVPEEAYTVVAPKPPRPVGNWAAFAAASEQLRIFAGLSQRQDFVENQVESQLFSFDENGMYRDPHEPMVYDLVTRLQLAAAVWFGYCGEGRERLCALLDRSAALTLQMQSVSGEIPYGGRSNQFLHNECFYAAMCEFYAARYQKSDPALAARFRHGALAAVENTKRWLSSPRVSHVKNGYPHREGMGCEGYAYFDKYMITAASWLYMALLFSDGSIPEGEAQGDGIFETSAHFHKVFCRYGDWFLEWDTAADPDYDATGLGRIHKKGAPSALLLSLPAARTPNYRLPEKNPRAFAIGGGVGDVFPSAEGVGYRLLSKEMGKDGARLVFLLEKDGVSVREEYGVSRDAVTLTVRGEGRVFAEVPQLWFDGYFATDVESTERCATVRYGDHTARMETDGAFSLAAAVHNRNGTYRILRAYGDGAVTVRFSVDGEG